MNRVSLVALGVGTLLGLGAMCGCESDAPTLPVTESPTPKPPPGTTRERTADEIGKIRASARAAAPDLGAAGDASQNAGVKE